MLGGALTYICFWEGKVRLGEVVAWQRDMKIGK